MLDERRVSTGQALLVLLLVVAGIIGGRLSVGAVSGGADAAGGERPQAGPTDSVAGVPVGYARTREGAVAAMTNYATVLTDPAFVSDRRRRREILNTIATEEVTRDYEGDANTLTQLADTPLYRDVRAGRPTIWTGAPLGYRVERYSDDEAAIFLWSVAVLGSDRLQPRAVYSSGVSRLRWVRGDWKLAGGTDQDGPVPAPLEDAESTSGEEFAARLRGLRGLRYVP